MLLFSDLPSPPPYALHQEVDQRAGNNILKIAEAYEQNGDYRNALRILQLGFCEDTAALERLNLAHFSLGASRLLFDAAGHPRAKLLELLQAVGCDPSFTSIEQINCWAQRHLLRRAERWQEQTTQFDALKPTLLPLLTALGFVDATYPLLTHYQGAIVHGGLLSRVRLRFRYLIEQWNRGVRFPALYCLTGARTLEKTYENREALMEDKEGLLPIRADWQAPDILPQTEYEMMQLVWEQSEIPEEMRQQLTVYFINAPAKENPRGGLPLRPNTDDTVDMWLTTAPPPGCYLAVTNAPYTNRQDVVIRTLSPENYLFDTIGPSASTEEKTAVFLDELARLIFQTIPLQ